MTADETRDQIALTDEERLTLHETSDHAPWHYTEFGVSCSCGLAIIDPERDYCQTMVNLEEAVERIIANRLASQAADQRARLAAVEALADEWADEPASDGDCPDGLCGACTLGIAAERLRAALGSSNTTGKESS